jgi:hypothetical protein
MVGRDFIGIVPSLFIFVGVFLFFPAVSIGYEGLIPCDGPECQACHFVQLGQNLLEWFIKTMAAVIALVFAWGGMKMVMSGGNTEGVSEAKGMMTNAVIGFIILLASWLIINTVLNVVISKNPEIQGRLGEGMWSQIECVALPTRTTATGDDGTGGVSAPSTTGGLSEAEVRSQLGGIQVVSSGNCFDRTNRSCTGLDGMQQGALTEIKNTITSCIGCDLQITAGTEPGHTNACHQNGTCVDITCKSGCSLDQTKAVFESASRNGARAVWEGADCGVRDTLRAQGREAFCKSDNGYGHITGTHFSLYTQ